MTSTPTQTADERIAADVALIQHRLSRVERDARKLMWSKERPWARDTHVWAEDYFPVLDLHDLSVNLGKKSVRRVVDSADHLQTGVFSIITGQGNNSIGPGKMKEAVASVLRRACQDHEGWSFRPDGPGRYILIMDEDKAPDEALTTLPRGFWLIILLFVLALLFAVFHEALGL
ncbi:MAG: Smr/MutS family protein [Myxococcota bacterium]